MLLHPPPPARNEVGDAVGSHLSTSAEEGGIILNKKCAVPCEEKRLRGREEMLNINMDHGSQDRSRFKGSEAR